MPEPSGDSSYVPDNKSAWALNAQARIRRTISTPIMIDVGSYVTAGSGFTARLNVDLWG